MKHILIASLVGFAALAFADDLGNEAWKLESNGNASAARELLQHAAESSSAAPGALAAYAEFLDRHHDPGARQAYERMLAMAPGPEHTAALRRLVLLDLLAGDRVAATKHLELYREAGATDFAFAPPESKPDLKGAIIQIPGPLRSFARMAALAPDVEPGDLLPALARNVVTNGYQAASSNEALDQTEYLKLVIRYLSQARELTGLAATDHVIHVDTCDSSQTGDLLRVLGYRMRGACGSDLVLETVNPTRAFLTIDSGFPLAELEQSLRTNRPFKYDYSPTDVQVLYGSDYWLSVKEHPNATFIDVFIGDPSLCRLYLGMSKLDPDTGDALRKSMSFQRIRAYSHVLDFYGAQFQIRDGKAIVPGGTRSEKAWGELAGAPADKPAAFFERLLARDDGWLASYFDALMRLNGPVQQYLTEPERLKRFYGAVHGKVTSPGPARPVFRSNTDMLLLTTRLRVDANGRPHIPGGVQVWRDLFIDHPHGKYDPKLTHAAPGWKDPDDVLEALFALCRKSVEDEPLKMFMALSDVDRLRAAPLDADTTDRMARSYHQFGAQYTIFSEVPEVSSAAINRYLDVAEGINGIHDPLIRADAAGVMQSLASLWQICYRQGSIAPADADRTLVSLLAPFGKLHSEREVFDGGRAGVKVLLAATHSPSDATPQARIFDLIAGTRDNDESDSRTQMLEEMNRIFESQRLISLTTIFTLSDQLESLSRGEKINPALINKTAAHIAETQLPRASLSSAEKSSLSYGFWPERHIDNQRKLNLRALMNRAATDPKKLEDARGILAPFLRDTLVGLIYVHYAPPGAQILLANPLFVRSHDFAGSQINTETWRATEVVSGGWPTSAGGKLSGSLIGLPYALAEAEQNFLVPAREQALIWGDLVPQMLLTAKVAHWSDITPAQLHWVGLHMTYAEALLAEGALNTAARAQVLTALERYAPPVRVHKVGDLLAAGQVRMALDNVTPAEMFAVSADMVRTKTGDAQPLASEIRREAAENPGKLSYAAISRAFGTPKPTLTNSYGPDLLYLRTFPTLMGYSSRILAESWESNLLYYASLADDIHLPPGELNLAVPAWTQQTVERIFATHLEDWPALLRSLRLVGEDVRQKSRQNGGTAVAEGGLF